MSLDLKAKILTAKATADSAVLRDTVAYGLLAKLKALRNLLGLSPWAFV